MKRILEYNEDDCLATRVILDKIKKTQRNALELSSVLECR